MVLSHIDLTAGVTITDPARCGCGGQCGCGGHGAHHGAPRGTGSEAGSGEAAVLVSTVGVSGVADAEDAERIRAEISEYGEVTAVGVAIVPGGVSLVTVESFEPFSLANAEAAIRDAGFRLALPLAGE